MTKEEKRKYLEREYMGKTIRIIHLVPGQFCDDNPRYAGKVGVVDYIDSEGHLFGTWDGLSILPDEDEFEVLDDE